MTQLDLPADRQLADSVEWGKQNLRDLTQVAEDVDLRWADEGKEWEPTGSLDRMRWVGAGFPDYPWLFGVDGEYTAHASVTLGQFGPIKDHMRALRDISDQLSDELGRRRPRGRRGRLDLARQGRAQRRIRRPARRRSTSTRTRSSSSRPPSR